MSENSGSNDEVRIDMGNINIEGDEVDRNETRVMMIEASAGLGGQVVGSLMSITLTSSTSSWPLIYCVDSCVMLGIIFIFAAISLRVRKPSASLIMAKMGATATALAIILSLASHLPPFLALTLGPFALLLISLSLFHDDWN